MKIEDSFKLLLLFVVAVTIALLSVYFITNKLNVDNLKPLKEAQNQTNIEKTENEEVSYEEKLENLKTIRVELDAQDTRTDKEKQADYEEKLKILEELRRQ